MSVSETGIEFAAVQNTHLLLSLPDRCLLTNNQFR